MLKPLLRSSKLGGLLAIGWAMGIAALFPQPAPAADPKVVAIILNPQGSVVFAEPEITIKAGESVKWVPKDAGFPHRLVPDTANDAFVDTGKLNSTNPPTQTFNTPGVIHYHCFFHPDTMKGTITVTAP